MPWTSLGRGPRSLAADGGIKSKESDSRAGLPAILGLTHAEKFEEPSRDADPAAQLVQWPVALAFSAARLQRKTDKSAHVIDNMQRTRH